MPDVLGPILPHAPAFLMVMFRLLGIFVYGPMFASASVPVQVRALLGLVLTFCVYPMIPPQVPMELSIATLGLAIGCEMLIGLVIGYGASLPLIAMQVSGVMIGRQMGMALAQVYNPDLETQTNTIGQLLFFTALVIFILLDGHIAMLGALIGSFKSIPLGVFSPDMNLLLMLIGLLNAMFELAIRVAIPLLCLMFLLTIAMGFIARTVPQINILSLGFPLRIISSMLLLISVLVIQFDAVSQSICTTLNGLIAIFAK